MFAEPEESGGARILPRDVLGHLLLVWATDYVGNSPTVNTAPGQRADLVVVDVVDLDQVDPETGVPGLLARKCWWRQTQLIASLKGRVGLTDPVLGRMGKGATTRGIPPFQLQSATGDPQAVARATAWMQAHPTFTPSLPGGGPAEVSEEEAQSTSGGPRTLNQGEETVLERLARQAASNRSAMPPTSPREGFEETIPF